MRKQDVNVTIVTRNQRSRFRACLESVLIQDHPVTVTVVDNHSSEEIRHDLKALHRAGVIKNLFLLDRDMGQACAANLGWDAEKTPFSMLLDTSAAFTRPDVITRLLRVAAHNPELATLSVRPGQHTAHRMAVLPSGYVVARPVDGLCGTACVLMSRSARALLGHWCEDYHFPGDEAVDFSYRAAKIGLICACLPSPDGNSLDAKAMRLLPADHPVGLPEDPDSSAHARLHVNLELYRLGLKPVFMQRTHQPRQKNPDEWELVARNDIPRHEEIFEPMSRLLHRQRSLVNELAL